MAKRRFSIAPKLKEPDTKKVNALPIQEISVEKIEEIATGKKDVTAKAKTTTRRRTATAKTAKKKAKKPQGRPRREEPVKRLSSDLPADLYDRVKREVKDNGYTLNGFLAKVLKEYFERKRNK